MLKNIVPIQTCLLLMVACFCTSNPPSQETNKALCSGSFGAVTVEFRSYALGKITYKIDSSFESLPLVQFDTKKYFKNEDTLYLAWYDSLGGFTDSSAIMVVERVLATRCSNCSPVLNNLYVNQMHGICGSTTQHGQTEIVFFGVNPATGDKLLARNIYSSSIPKENKEDVFYCILESMTFEN